MFSFRQNDEDVKSLILRGPTNNPIAMAISSFFKNYLAW